MTAANQKKPGTVKNKNKLAGPKRNAENAERSAERKEKRKATIKNRGRAGR